MLDSMLPIRSAKEQPLLNQWNTWHSGKHRKRQASLWAEARFRRSLIPWKTVKSIPHSGLVREESPHQLTVSMISLRGLGAQRSSSRRGSALEKPQTFSTGCVSPKVHRSFLSHWGTPSFHPSHWNIKPIETHGDLGYPHDSGNLHMDVSHKPKKIAAVCDGHSRKQPDSWYIGN